jgi:catechol 2,3-dioxygenase-like lactoylglutathione lyase family enzyme
MLERLTTASRSRLPRGLTPMLDRFQVHATLPASDLDRARNWYRDKLGLTPAREDEVGLWYEFAGSRLLLYPSSFAGTSESTAAEWLVEDIESVAETLRGRGVVFEEYDLPGLKTEKGLTTIGAHRTGWFKDSEGNILSLDEAIGER